MSNQIDITPNPWAMLYLAGRYKEGDEMKRKYQEARRKGEQQ